MSEFAEGITEEKDGQAEGEPVTPEPGAAVGGTAAQPSEADLDAAAKESEIAAETEAAPLTVNPHGQTWNPEVYATNPDGTPAVDSMGHYIKKEQHYAPAASGWPGQS